MSCDVCARPFNLGRRKPLCTSCAWAVLYSPRYQQASALLDREKFHTQAEAVIRPYNDGVLAALPADADLDILGASSKKYNDEQRRLDHSAIDDRVRRITDKAQELKEQIKECQDYIAAQKLSHEQRRKDVAAERAEFERYKPRLLEPVQHASRKAALRLDRLHDKIVDARHLLCREVAATGNLQRRKTWNGKSDYRLGDIPIPDLRELNLRTQVSKDVTPVGSRTIAEPHDLVSEAFENIARLMGLCSHYLHVRLPAEIITPHHDFPRSVVMPEKSSYKMIDIPFPGSSSSQTSSPMASRIVERNLPRPRPLYLDRPLAQLMKDDPKSYGLFIEGVMLLAWDLAWLCKTQGIDNISTFEDVCAIGRNMWLLVNTIHRKDRPKSQRQRKPSSTASKDEDAQVDEVGLCLGVYSHDSVKHNLASAEGLELMRDWRLASSARLVDKLKSFLVHEISGAEWDMLEGQEWDEERPEEEPVLVGGSRRPRESRRAALSATTAARDDGNDNEKHDNEDTDASDARRKGNSGWMKIRGRNGDGA